MGVFPPSRLIKMEGVIEYAIENPSEIDRKKKKKDMGRQREREQFIGDIWNVLISNKKSTAITTVYPFYLTKRSKKKKENVQKKKKFSYGETLGIYDAEKKLDAAERF